MICEPLLGPYWMSLLHPWLAPVLLLIDSLQTTPPYPSDLPISYMI